MAIILDGGPASEGIASGPVFHLEWGLAFVPHITISEDLVQQEMERFHEARLWATQRLQELKVRTAERLGPVEARIFDPQIMMLEDAEVVEGSEKLLEVSFVCGKFCCEPVTHWGLVLIAEKTKAKHSAKTTQNETLNLENRQKT